MKFIPLDPHSPLDLRRYASIPIAYQTETILRIIPQGGSGLDGLRLIEEQIDPPYLKDYDRMGGDTGPASWVKELGPENLVLYLAEKDGRAAGGFALMPDTSGFFLHEGRPDLALLWDLRVLPELRFREIGRSLFQFAVAVARAHDCRQMKIETQTTNPAACRFYAAMGCTLGAIHRYAYAAIPQAAQEAMLLWYLDL